MVNLGHGDAPEDQKYKIDGSYVPRNYFLKQDGTVLPDFPREISSLSITITPWTIWWT